MPGKQIACNLTSGSIGFIAQLQDGVTEVHHMNVLIGGITGLVIDAHVWGWGVNGRCGEANGGGHSMRFYVTRDSSLVNVGAI